MDSDDPEVENTALRATRVLQLGRLEDQVATLESQLRQARIGVPGLAMISAVLILRNGFAAGGGGIVSLSALVTAIASVAWWAVFEWRARRRIHSTDEQIGELQVIQESPEPPKFPGDT